MPLKTAYVRWIVGTVVTALAGLLPFLISEWRTPKKRISYEVFAQTFDHPAERIKALAFVVGDRRVNNVELATVRIANNGTLPITRGDFDEDLFVRFPEKAELLTAEARRVVPESMKIDGVQSKTRFAIKPLLLNPGDEIVVSAVLTYPERSGPADAQFVAQQLAGTHISVSTHVAGMRPPARIEPTFRRDYLGAVLGAISTLLYGYLGATFFSAVRSSQAIPTFERFVLTLVVLTGSSAFPNFLVDDGISRWVATMIGLALAISGVVLGVWRMSARIRLFSRQPDG
jgi:hypothetical protein